MEENSVEIDILLFAVLFYENNETNPWSKVSTFGKPTLSSYGRDDSVSFQNSQAKTLQPFCLCGAEIMQMFDSL